MKEDQSKYYIVKSNDIVSLEWEKYQTMYYQAMKDWSNMSNQKPLPGEDPKMVREKANMQFLKDCSNIQIKYQDRFENGALPVPVTIDGKQKNIINGEEYILVKDPTANFQPSIADDSGYDISIDRAIYDIPTKVQYNTFQSAKLATQFWNS